MKIRLFSIVAAIVVVVLILSWFSTNDSYSRCRDVKKADVWLSRKVQTREDLRAEINDVVIDNHCDGITADKLRKILLDVEKVTH